MFFFTVIMYTPLTSGTHAVLQEQGMHYTLLCTTHLSLQFFYNHVQLHLLFTTNQRRMHVFFTVIVYTPLTSGIHAVYNQACITHFLVGFHYTQEHNVSFCNHLSPRGGTAFLRRYPQGGSSFCAGRNREDCAPSLS